MFGSQGIQRLCLFDCLVFPDIESFFQYFSLFHCHVFAYHFVLKPFCGHSVFFRTLSTFGWFIRIRCFRKIHQNTQILCSFVLWHGKVSVKVRAAQLTLLECIFYQSLLGKVQIFNWQTVLNQICKLKLPVFTGDWCTQFQRKIFRISATRNLPLLTICDSYFCTSQLNV